MVNKKGFKKSKYRKAMNEARGYYMLMGPLYAASSLCSYAAFQLFYSKILFNSFDIGYKTEMGNFVQYYSTEGRIMAVISVIAAILAIRHYTQFKSRITLSFKNSKAYDFIVVNDNFNFIVNSFKRLKDKYML